MVRGQRTETIRIFHTPGQGLYITLKAIRTAMHYLNSLKSIVRLVVLALAPLAMVACGGGGGAGSDDSAGATRSALQATNLAGTGFPWGGAAPGLLKRWNLPIPVKTNEEARAVAAMDEIERRLGITVFDRTSIATLPDAQIARGIVVRVGTAFLPAGGNPASYCANVAAAPGVDSWTSPAATPGGVMSYRLYVNLDNPQCRADSSIVIHEFGHALGMGEHYEGFGQGSAISDLFWRVLRTIYANPPGTPANVILVP